MPKLWLLPTTGPLVVILTPFGGRVHAPWALAIGFDPVQFGLFTRGIGTRVLQKNTLDGP